MELATLSPIPAPAAQGPRLTRLGDLLGEWAAEADASHTAHLANRPRGPVTGIRPLDVELGGCLPVGLNIAHGMPGAGKTAFALQIAASCGCPALYVTCEMAPLELLRRLIARVTGTYLGRLRSGELSAVEAVSLAKRAIAEAPDLALADATRWSADPSWLLDAAVAVRGDAQHLLLVIDSVHSWAESRVPAGMEIREAINAALATLRGLASELGCPILAIAERNRASMKGGGLAASAESRKFEYSAETVLDLQRDPEKRPDAYGKVPVTVDFAKNRNGVAGKKVNLVFFGAVQRFEED